MPEKLTNVTWRTTKVGESVIAQTSEGEITIVFINDVGPERIEIAHLISAVPELAVRSTHDGS